MVVMKVSVMETGRLVVGVGGVVLISQCCADGVVLISQ